MLLSDNSHLHFRQTMFVLKVSRSIEDSPTMLLSDNSHLHFWQTMFALKVSRSMILCPLTLKLDLSFFSVRRERCIDNSKHHLKLESFFFFSFSITYNVFSVASIKILPLQHQFFSVLSDDFVKAPALILKYKRFFVAQNIVKI